MHPTAKSRTDAEHVGKGIDVITPRPSSVPAASPDLDKDPDEYINEPPNDCWIHKWDVTVHRCQLCHRPFATNEKLNLHVLTWHSDGSPVLPPYTGYRSANTAKSEPQKVIIAEGGDLYLNVGRLEDKLVYQVASQTLWVASRVFRKMFGPDSPFSERILVKRAGITGFPPAELTLDDDPVAFSHVLNVLHHRFHQVPGNVDFPVLVAIAAIVDKYELRDAMTLWAQKWSQYWTSSLKKPGFEDWLFVSWVFRLDQQFIDISRELSLRAIRMPNGDLVFADGDVKRQLCEQTPSSVLRGLAEIRESRVEKMRKEFETLHTERQPTGARKICEHPTNYQQCDAMQYGYLLVMRDIFGLLGDQARNYSARKISADLGSISSFRVPVHDRTNQSCSFGGRGFPYSNCQPGPCSCPSHTSCSWVPGITSLAKEMIAVDLHLTLEDFP